MIHLLRAWPRALSLVGWPGVVGIGLLAFGAMFYLSAYLPAQERADRLATRLAAPRPQPRPQPAEAEAVGLSGVQAQFPTLEQVPDMLARLFQMAEAQKVYLAKASYKHLPGQAPGLTVYRIELPITADYAGIRRFLAQAMNAFPALALDRIEFKRGKEEGEHEVDATLRLTLYLRTP